MLCNTNPTFCLSQSVNFRNASKESAPSKAPVKVEMQVLRLDEDSQKLVLDTLKYIHGNDFVLGDISNYKDRGTKMKNKYWQERGNLVIQGGYDYSNVANSGSATEDRFRTFAIMKLESYGFPKQHCMEALDHCKGDVDTSLELLFTKYFPTPSNEDNDDKTSYTDEELMELRMDEKLALESIYDHFYEEKERNKVWQLKFKVDHLLVYSPSEQKKLQTAFKEQQREIHIQKMKKVEKCRNFLKGKCSYGERCRFSHAVEVIDKSLDKTDPNLDPNWFYLEVRFPTKNVYPFEAPIVCLKTTCPDIPREICLRLTRRLLAEAREIAKDGMPSIYTLSEFLQMDEEICQFLKHDRFQFLDSKKSLFHIPSQDDQIEIIKKDLPTHYEKGSTGKTSKSSYTMEQLLREDANIVKKFMNKQTNLNYKNMLKLRKELPAWNKMTEILNLVAMSQVRISQFSPFKLFILYIFVGLSLPKLKIFRSLHRTQSINRCPSDS